MSDGLLISVIVPAHNAERHLGFCLDALAGNDLERDRWELIVVDDASTDSTPETINGADVVLSTGAVARGPAFARNRGADAARGDILVFIDSDVAVHSTVLRLFADRFDSDVGLVAVFGSYDDSPFEQSVVSRYRNLLHHHAHHQNAGEVPTFWAGCGAVRAGAFHDVGGFDEVRYRMPQIEDIELGYRLRGMGRILLDPAIQSKHYKKWLLWPMIKTDFRDRAVPWVRLLLETRQTEHSSAPSLGPGAIIGTAVAGIAAAGIVLGAIGMGRPAYVVGITMLLLSIYLNRRLYMWYRSIGGARLALPAIPLHFVYLVLSAVAVPVGAARFFFDQRRRPADSDALAR